MVIAMPFGLLILFTRLGLIQILEATKVGDVAAVQRLIIAGGDINVIDQVCGLASYAFHDDNQFLLNGCTASDRNNTSCIQLTALNSQENMSTLLAYPFYVVAI